MSSDRPTPAAEALTELILEIFRVNGDLLEAGNGLARPSGQTSARWQVLGALRGGALTVAAIARSMGLARQSVQRTSDLLAGEGLVEFMDNPAHRRAKLVQLTAEGREVLLQISERQVEWVNGLAEALPFDEERVRAAVQVLLHLRMGLTRTDSLDDQRAAVPNRQSVEPRPERVRTR